MSTQTGSAEVRRRHSKKRFISCVQGTLICTDKRRKDSRRFDFSAFSTVVLIAVCSNRTGQDVAERHVVPFAVWNSISSLYCVHLFRLRQNGKYSHAIIGMGGGH